MSRAKRDKDAIVARSPMPPVLQWPGLARLIRELEEIEIAESIGDDLQRWLDDMED
jgi:hypothetical protein